MESNNIGGNAMDAKLRQKFKDDYEKYKNTTAKIALIGQPGAGKSSLINSLVGQELFKTGVHTDTTIEAQETRFQSLIITDLPGYGTERFPIEKWVEEFQPEQYDLYLFVFDGKLHDSDSKLFEYLKKWKQERKHPFFIVRSKEDTIWDPNRSIEDLKNDIVSDVKSRISECDTKVYFVSSKDKTGIDELKNAIFQSPIIEAIKDKIIHDFKATTINDLKLKREQCKRTIHKYAAMSAANAFNPIPGTDVAVDFCIIKEMFDDIKCNFGLEDIENVTKYEEYGPIAVELVNKILYYWVLDNIPQLIKFLLKHYGKKILLQKASKWIPLIGNAVSATISIMIIEMMGKEYADDCYALAEIILKEAVSKEA